MRRILCFGDSNTHGADPDEGPRFAEEVRYPGVLAAALGPGFRVIEEGMGGRTTVLDDPFEPWRNGRTYLRPCLLSHQPLDLVALMLGTNDLKLRHAVPPEDICRGVEQLVGDVRWLLGAEAKVLIVAPVPTGTPILSHPRLGAMFGAEVMERSRALAPLYLELAEAMGCGFFDAGTVAKLEHGDGLHLSPRDHKALGAALAGVVAAMLG